MILFLLIASISWAGEPVKVPSGFNGTLFFHSISLGDFAPETFTDTATKPILEKLKGSPQENAKLLFDHYCQGGKPRRKFTQAIKLVLPSIPKGIPLDEARKLKEAVMERGRDRVKNFYVDAAFAWVKGADERRYRTSADVAASEVSFYGLEKNSKKEAIEAFKAGAVEANELNPSDAFNFVVVGDELFAFYAAKNTAMKVRNEINHWRMDRRVRSGLLSGKVFVLGNKVETDDDHELFPLLSLTSAELVLWTSQYALLASGDSISAAVEHQQQNWRSYLRENITLKEEPAKGDEQIVNYEVELGLGLMCQRSRFLFDLKSH